MHLTFFIRVFLVVASAWPVPRQCDRVRFYTQGSILFVTPDSVLLVYRIWYRSKAYSIRSNFVMYTGYVYYTENYA